MATEPKKPAGVRVAKATPLEERIARLENHAAAMEDRIDRIADALVPALHAWKNLSLRIPRWLLSTAPPPPLPDPLHPPRRAEPVDDPDDDEDDDEIDDQDDDDEDDDEDDPE